MRRTLPAGLNERSRPAGSRHVGLGREDREADTGEYWEPNVWIIIHETRAATPR
jgi:hypothetical protein